MYEWIHNNFPIDMTHSGHCSLGQGAIIRTEASAERGLTLLLPISSRIKQSGAGPPVGSPCFMRETGTFPRVDVELSKPPKHGVPRNIAEVTILPSE
jgi:hypothetical protein